MKEINIAKVLINKRREKGVTQDVLADYIGVSKASVSKWETAQSYPDVTLLPVLASYFNISIDELIDYKPQMTKDDIRKLYLKLSGDFAERPFDSVIEDCHSIIKKYYSCFPLLVQIGILLVNHVPLQKDPQKSASLIQEAKALFARIQEESGDISLIKKALFMDAYCSLAAGDPNSTLELLDGTIETPLPPESLMAAAYQMTGRIEDAKSILQTGIFQNIVVLFNFFPAYLSLCADVPSKFEQVLERALVVADAFDMKRLHPGVLVGMYLSAAQGYLAQQNTDQALDMLQTYTDIVTGDIYPLKLHGDDFFDLMDDWLDELDLGDALPRDEKTIRQSMADVIVKNPIFSVLFEEPRFKSLSEKLLINCHSA